MTTTALIAGGSIAGLATARALSSRFDRILLLDADQLDHDGFARKGTPQANHVHGLLKSGSDVLTRLFPDLPERLIRAGAVSCNFSQEVRWYINGGWMPRFDGSMRIYFQTRPLLEGCLRAAVRETRNIEVLDNIRVEDFTLDDAGQRVVAAVVRRNGGEAEVVAADFFVDAMGRGSLFPRWLKREGFGTVPEDHIRVNLGYASCLLELPETPRDWKSILIYPKGPGEIRGSTLVKVEGGKWLLTLAGYHDDHPPADMAGFLQFARTLPRPDIFEAVKDAHIVSDIRLHKFPHGQWRHYDRLPRFPLGILPVGDSNTSLNPLFGQGMSVAALSAAMLGDLATEVDFRKEHDLDELRRQYFTALRRIFATPWDLARGQDFRYPETVGPKPLTLPLKNALKSLIMSSASTDVVENFYQVVHLVKNENSFYHPQWWPKLLAGMVRD